MYQIKKLTLGVVQTNCYLLYRSAGGEAVVIDPAAHAETIASQLRQLELTPKAILLTHGHFDHVGAAEALKNRYGIPVYAHEKEIALAADEGMNGGRLFGIPGHVNADRAVSGGEVLHLAGFAVTVLYTPGHTIGGVCYYLPEEQILFSGDTLFARSVGRTDLPTGSERMLVRSIREKLLVLPDAVHVYPGHDAETFIGDEKKYNPYV